MRLTVRYEAKLRVSTRVVGQTSRARPDEATLTGERAALDPFDASRASRLAFLRRGRDVVPARA